MLCYIHEKSSYSSIIFSISERLCTQRLLEKHGVHGGQLSSHFGHGPDKDELHLRCDAECSYHAKVCVDLIQRYHGMVLKFGEGGEYDLWNYKCVSKEEASNRQ